MKYIVHYPGDPFVQDLGFVTAGLHYGIPVHILDFSIGGRGVIGPQIGQRGIGFRHFQGGDAAGHATEGQSRRIEVICGSVGLDCGHAELLQLRYSVIGAYFGQYLYRVDIYGLLHRTSEGLIASVAGIPVFRPGPAVDGHRRVVDQGVCRPPFAVGLLVAPLILIGEGLGGICLRGFSSLLKGG